MRAMRAQDIGTSLMRDQSHAHWELASESMEGEWAWGLYVVRVDAYTGWSDWWSVEDWFGLMMAHDEQKVHHGSTDCRREG